MSQPLSAPFPYFGGKRRAASLIWAELGDPSGYVEPFAGSAAVLLARPAFEGRRVETINDADGWLVNTWRAIQLDPAAVAQHAYGPVTEIDYHARLAWLQERRTPDLDAASGRRERLWTSPACLGVHRQDLLDFGGGDAA